MEIKKQPINWSLNEGDAYLRKWVEILEEIERIDIEGSKIFYILFFHQRLLYTLMGRGFILISSRQIE